MCTADFDRVPPKSRIYLSGAGVVVLEPSVAAVDCVSLVPEGGVKEGGVM